ncbi:MAG: hypothetical protein ACRDIV_02195 [Ktedonobacteraceae bacterium]
MHGWFIKNMTKLIRLILIFIGVILLVLCILVISLTWSNPGAPSSTYYLTAFGVVLAFLSILSPIWLPYLSQKKGSTAISSMNPALSDEQKAALNILCRREKANLRKSHRGKGTLIVLENVNDFYWPIVVANASNPEVANTRGDELSDGLLYGAIIQDLMPDRYTVTHRKDLEDPWTQKKKVRGGEVTIVDFRTSNLQNSQENFSYLI